MKKILLFSIFNKYGGTRSFFNNVLKFYNNKNYKIKIVLKRNQLDNELDSFFKERKIEYFIIPGEYKFIKLLKRLPVIKYLFITITNCIYFFLFKPIIKEFKPDLIFVTHWSHWLPDNIFLGLIFYNIPSIYYVHSYPLKLDNFLYRRILRSAISKNNFFVTVSNFSKNMIIKNWFNKYNSDKVKYILNCSSVDKIGGNINNLKKNVLKVFTAGAIVKYKNPDVWFKVAQKVINELNDKNIEFVWAGDGTLLDKFREKVINLNYTNIKFIGYSNNLKGLYRDTSIYFQPSLIESHGITVVDALKFGIPCVVSNVGGLPESINNGENGFVVDVDDIDRMVEKIILLLKDKDLRKKMGEKAKVKYNKYFTFAIWEKNMLYLHNKILNNNR